MLSGERTRTYVTREREPREVCDLCIVRAENAGWLVAELAAAGMPAEPHEGRGRMRRLLSRAREEAASRSPARRAGENGSPSEADATDRVEAPRPRRRRPREEAESMHREGGRREPSERPKRTSRGIPQKPERRIRRAFESFNQSEHRRTVGGLIRSLGAPNVSAVTTAEAPADVRITVAWELSWYQWDVDLAAEGRPIRELGRGDEISELARPNREWNAEATEDGALRLAGEGPKADA